MRPDANRNTGELTRELLIRPHKVEDFHTSFPLGETKPCNALPRQAAGQSLRYFICPGSPVR